MILAAGVEYRALRAFKIFHLNQKILKGGGQEVQVNCIEGFSRSKLEKSYLMEVCVSILNDVKGNGNVVWPFLEG